MIEAYDIVIGDQASKTMRVCMKRLELIIHDRHTPDIGAQHILESVKIFNIRDNVSSVLGNLGEFGRGLVLLRGIRVGHYDATLVKQVL